ncbi:MAG: hypothetical protein V4721_05490 [Bacteroidota bacterium]
MKKMTDRELTDKISQVFDNFEDPTAEQGWQELRKKYPESDTKPVLLWWSAAAAVLVVLGGLWFMTRDTNLADQSIADKKSPSEIEKEKVVSDDSAIVKSDETNANTAAPASQKSGSGISSESLKSSSTYVIDETSIKKNRESRNQGTLSPVQSFEKTAQIDLSRSNKPAIVITDNSLDNNPVVALPAATLSVSNSEVSRDSIIEATGRMLALAPQNLSQDSHTHRVEETPYHSRTSSTKNQLFSVFAGSYFNYSLGSETKLNFGAGFTSDINLGNNLRLTTGLALAKNTLTYNNGVPSSRSAQRAYDAVPSFGLNNGGLLNNSLTTVTKYNASLLALDIPVNVKYLIIPRDNKLYLLAGFSSGTYLTETYSLDYRNYSPAGAYINQGQGIEVKNQLQAFDLARTLNISFGYSANLGKTQNITIEPFLKYPLGGLGSEDLRFGSTGINLKLNFSKFKK